MRRSIQIIAAFLTLFAIWICFRFFANRWGHSDLVVSTATTRLTEPLDELGYPDYIAALNAQLSKGVTPDNNALVLLMQALGPKDIPAAHREEFFRRLGMPPLSEQGSYLEEWYTYMQDRRPPVLSWEPIKGREGPLEYDRRMAVETAALNRPWQRANHPELATWLAENQQALDTVVEATRRGRFYMPLVGTGKTHLHNVLLPMPPRFRAAARGLTYRAMMHLGEGDIDAAWEDLMACHRLARLTAQGATLVEGLTAITIDAIAFYNDIELVQHADLSADQAARFARELDALPPMPPMADRLDTCERYAFLDLVRSIAKHGPEELFAIERSMQDGLFTELLMKSLDWNACMVAGNDWFDRLAAAARIADPRQRAAALQQYESDLRTFYTGGRGGYHDLLSLVSKDAASERMSRRLIWLMLRAHSSALLSESQQHNRTHLLRLAMALAEHRSTRGAFPATLAELAPATISKLPVDALTGQPFAYARTEDGYRLYSFGPNQQDDGGRNANDGIIDDVLIEVPPTLADDAK